MRYFKRIVRQIHLWLGLLSGLVVLILGITGCIYAFEEELQTWLYADKLYVKPTDTPENHWKNAWSQHRPHWERKCPYRLLSSPMTRRGLMFFTTIHLSKTPKAPALSDSTQIASANPLAIIHRSLEAEYPQAKQFFINFPQDKKGAYGVYVDTGTPTRTGNDYLYFDQYAAREIKRETWADKSGGDKVHALKYNIHVGAIGGLPGKVIAFFLSLFSASLPVTGFIMWYSRKLRVKSV